MPVLNRKLSSTEQKLQLFKSIMDVSKEKIDADEFVNTVKEELLNDDNNSFLTCKIRLFLLEIRKKRG